MVVDEVRYTAEQVTDSKELSILSGSGLIATGIFFAAIGIALLKHGLSNDQNIETNREEN